MSKRYFLSSFLLVTFSVAQLALAMPSLKHGDLAVTLSETGVAQLQYLTLVLEGKVAVWGANFYYDSTYWGEVNATVSPEDEGIASYVKSPDGEFSWHIGVVSTGEDFMLLKYVVQAESNWTFQAVAWVVDLPIGSFAGRTVYALLLPYGTTREVALRSEHVPGSPELFSDGNGGGWIVPFGMDTGFAIAMLTDLGPRIGLAATDEREWGGSAYRLRWYPPGSWTVTRYRPGDKMEFYIYVHAFTGKDETEKARQKIYSICYLRDLGLSTNEVVDLILRDEVEAYLEKIRSERQTMLIAYVLTAIAVVAAAVLSLWFMKKRR